MVVNQTENCFLAMPFPMVSVTCQSVVLFPASETIPQCCGGSVLAVCHKCCYDRLCALYSWFCMAWGYLARSLWLLKLCCWKSAYSLFWLFLLHGRVGKCLVVNKEVVIKIDASVYWSSSLLVLPINTPAARCLSRNFNREWCPMYPFVHPVKRAVQTLLHLTFGRAGVRGSVERQMQGFQFLHLTACKTSVS